MNKLIVILIVTILVWTILNQAAESQNRGNNLNSTQRNYLWRSIFHNHWIHPSWNEKAFLWQQRLQNQNDVLLNDNWFLDQFSHRNVADLFSNFDSRPTISPIKTTSQCSDVTEAWVRHYTSGRMPGTDRAVDIATDHAGNVYVTGYSTSPGFGYDFYTIKYNSSGEQLWSRRYDNNRNDEWATAICTDGSGNVYVTGYSDFCHVTIKYDTHGVEQWVSVYQETLPELIWITKWPPDITGDLAVDHDGNVFVTGINVTIKYDAVGQEMWVAPFEEQIPEPSVYVGPADLVLDDSGNVYITGTIYRAENTQWLCKTVKYNAYGAEQWHAYDEGIYVSAALAIDNDGNVYITGTKDHSYATIKYNASGIQQWIAHHHPQYGGSATSIAVDDSGYVYVTGWGATIKYNAFGVEQWVVPGYGDDLILDNSSNVYITGSEFITVKYDAMGIEQWTADYNGPDNKKDAAHALVLDDSGNVYVTGTCDDINMQIFGHHYGNYATVKYDASGVEQWVDRYDGPGDSGDSPTDIAVDDSGNVYVTGTTEYLWSPDDVVDHFTIKYDATGNQQWVASYDGGNTIDRAYANAVDDAGNVHVTGTSSGDYLTIKYNRAGTEEWVTQFEVEGDGAHDIAIDKSGNVYVTGTKVTIKYNKSGVQQWVANGSGYFLIIDGNCNVYISGYRNDDCITIKYDSSGIQQWSARYNGPGNGFDYPSGIAIDGAGNVYITCSSTGIDSSFDYATLKYDSSGNEQWVARYQGPTGSLDGTGGIAVDKAGNVYITGSSDGDYVTVKYNSQGVEQWIARYNSPDNGHDWATDIAIDNNSNIYVTGYSRGGYATIKYDCSGNEQWIALYAGPGGASNLALDNIGSVYVIGSTSGMVTTIKYTETGTPVLLSESDTGPLNFNLTQNYPNPFNSSTVISYQLPVNSHVELSIYNLLGQKIVTLVSERQSAGIQKFNWDARVLASGVYLYRLEAGDFVQVKKLVLMR